MHQRSCIMDHAARMTQWPSRQHSRQRWLDAAAETLHAWAWDQQAFYLCRWVHLSLIVPWWLLWECTAGIGAITDYLSRLVELLGWILSDSICVSVLVRQPCLVVCGTRISTSQPLHIRLAPLGDWLLACSRKDPAVVSKVWAFVGIQAQSERVSHQDQIYFRSNSVLWQRRISFFWIRSCRMLEQQQNQFANAQSQKL